MTINVLSLALGLGFVATTALARPSFGFDPLVDYETIHKRTNKASCDLNDPAPSVTAPKANPWAPITPDDNLAVWNLLHDPATGLNLTDPSKAKLTDNYVFWIDTLHTNKTDVIPFIDGDGPMPPKYARAVIFRGAIEEPDSQEFMIGPLPVGPETKVEKLDYIFNGGRGGSVPFNARYFDSVRSSATEPLLREVMSSIADITEALVGGVYYGGSDNRTTLTSTSGTPMTYDGTQVFRTIMFRYPGSASYLTPLDFFVLLDCPGQDPSKFKLKGIVTDSQFFPTVESIRTAFEAGKVVKKFDQDRNATWALVDYKPELGTRDLEDQFAPQNLPIGGKRYKIDRDARYVEYLGWSYYLSYTRSLGVMLYDIRFKGERVIYELSLQEAAAQYAGFQPKAASTAYHDTYYSLGTDIATLVEGFDCPFGSTFLPVHYHTNNHTVTNPDSICIFEADIGYPVSRHRSGGSGDYGFQNIGTVKGTALTTRSIATVGNYDYMFDYQFYTDGTLEVTVRASGYLQSSFYYPEQSRFGPRIQVATQGSLHDHIVTYKADLDIAGTANSLQMSELVIKNQSQPWFPELGEFEQMELEVSYFEEEKMFNWLPNNAAMYCVVNKDAKNQWGETRGYRIIPGRSNIHLTPLNSPFTRAQSAFSKTHLAVTVQHDNEPYANSPANINLPWAPQQDFTKFFDGESVDQKDIVVWFNLGMHHFTRAEDIPVTLYTEAVSSIMFAPQNYFDRAQDGDLLNRRWIVPDSKTGELTYEDYGVELPQCKVALTEPVLNINKILSTEDSEYKDLYGSQ